MLASLALLLASCLTLPNVSPAPPRAAAATDATWVTLDSGVSTDVYLLDFVSPTEGWAVGWSTFSGMAVILSTDDGGRSWQVRHALADDLLFGISVGRAGRVLAVGQRGDGDDGLILTSTDHGDTWTETVLPTSFGLYDVQLLPSGRAFACGYDGAIFRSDDAGLSWTQLDTGTSKVFRALSVVSDDTVYAMGGTPFGGDSVWVSHDGGGSWALRKQFGGALIFSDLHFSDADTGVIVGTGVFRTVNGGVNWKKDMQIPDVAELGVMQRVNFHGAVGVTVGGAGHTLRSLDHGETWELLGTPSPQGAQLACSPRGEGVVVAGSPAAFHHWIPAPAPDRGER